MKHLFFILLLIQIVSCTTSKNKVQVISESFPTEDISIVNWNSFGNSSLVFNNSEESTASKEKIIALLDRIPKTDSIKTRTDLNKVLSAWNELKKIEQDSEIPFYNWTDSNIVRTWYNLNLELFKFQKEPIFIEELEKLVFGPHLRSYLDENLLKQLVFTKMDDQICVNIFTESSAQYQHTTGGTIRISQETNYPDDGHVTIRFETSDKRFVELFIFIPSWSGKATVTVGGVKYKAVPGEYCRVAKMWKSGNNAEIHLEHTQMPI